MAQSNAMWAKQAYNILARKTQKGRAKAVERERGDVSGIGTSVSAIGRFVKDATVSGTAATLLIITPLSHLQPNRVQFTSAEIGELTAMPAIPVENHEKLNSVRFVGPATLELRFVDKAFYLPISKLDLANDQIMWGSVVASPTGEMITVKAATGEIIPIDSATLRYLVDGNYAARIDKSIADLHIPISEAKTATSRQVINPRWKDVCDDDLLE